jgi:drug/metabolite transporter (DMT)-like permease
MGTFSPIHWIIAIALLAALGAFVYFVGSLLWAGAKSQGKGKLIAAAVLLPVVVLALMGIVGASDKPNPPTERWKSGIPVN